MEDTCESPVWITTHKRRGRKDLVTVEGLKAGLDYRELLKAFKNAYSANGTFHHSHETGPMMKLQGDQLNNILEYLINNRVYKREQIVIQQY